MSKLPVIAIFDVGKTNKKLFLFDESYQLVYEKSARFTETVDEDGFSCENLESLKSSVFSSLREVSRNNEFEIKAVNFSAYGASFVYINEKGKPVAPLYNYLKPYPEELQKQFYDTYGGEKKFSKDTASPVLGNLNSGMQIYRIKYQNHELFEKIKYALHLPQYLSYLITGQSCSDITSIGCHTNLWDFTKDDYHEWVYKEGIAEKLAPIVSSDSTMPATGTKNKYQAGVGLHDSSAALIPYLINFHEPFILLSTGTWCISLNPFNDSLLTTEELANDCLCYMQYKGKPVKASRLFAGFEHEQQVKRIAEHFNRSAAWYRSVKFDPEILSRLQSRKDPSLQKSDKLLKESSFGQRDMTSFSSANEAYHQLILDLVVQQYASTLLIMNKGIRRIFVDGGFSKNVVYMNLLAVFFPEMEIFAASMAQSTAIGTALAIHNQWNKKQLPNDLIELKYYSLSRI